MGRGSGEEDQLGKLESRVHQAGHFYVLMDCLAHVPNIMFLCPLSHPGGCELREGSSVWNTLSP